MLEAKMIVNMIVPNTDSRRAEAERRCLDRPAISGQGDTRTRILSCASVHWMHFARAQPVHIGERGAYLLAIYPQ
jgi:hypothetical protein